MCGSVLSGIVLSEPAQAGCVNTTNATQCSNGTSDALLNYVDHNPLYVGGDFVLGLDNFQANDLGVLLTGVRGDSMVKLSNGSVVKGGSLTPVGAAGILVYDNFGAAVTVDIRDTSYVDASHTGILVISQSIFAKPVNVLTGTGSISGQMGAGIDVSSTRDVNVNVGGNVSGTNGISVGTQGRINLTTAAGYEAIGTSLSGLIVGGAAVQIDAHGRVVGEQCGICSGAYGRSVINTFDSVKGKTGYGISAKSSIGGGSNILHINGDVSGGLDGIRASHDLGDVFIEANAAVVGFGGHGITAVTGTNNFGNVSVITGVNSKVVGEGGDGIKVSTNSITFSDRSIGSVKIASGGAVSGSASGINAKSQNGSIDIKAAGDVVGLHASGITAKTQDGAISIKTAAGTTTRAGELSPSVSSNAGYGISAEIESGPQNSSKNIDILADSDVSGDSGGIRAFAFYRAVSVATGGNVKSAQGDGVAATAKAIKLAIGGDVDARTLAVSASSYGGDVNITTAIDHKISGLGGIFAQANQGGNVTVNSQSEVLADLDGIRAISLRGNAKVSSGVGAIISAKESGIVAVGKSSVVATAGDITARRFGILSVADASDVKVEVLQNSLIQAGSHGILTDAFSTAKVSNAGMVMGSKLGVLVAGRQGNILINSGSISNASLAESDLAVASDFSAFAIMNEATGTIHGRLETAIEDFDDSFNNAGLWQTGGESKFGGGNDTVSNSGLIKFGSQAGVSETATFSSLESLVNTGTISGLDHAQSLGSTSFDVLNISGDYVGGNEAVLALDVFVGPGSLADVMSVDGDTSGKTAIQIRNTNPVQAGPDANGISLVKVKGNASASDFFLAGGPVNAGLFSYNLAFIAAAGDNRFVLQSTPGAAVSETVVALDSLQNIWQGGVNAWNTHQGDLRDDVEIVAVADPAIPETRGNKAFWASVRGDWLQRSSQTSFNYLNATNSYSAGYNQQSYGIDGGIDFVSDLGDDARAMFGIVAGYTQSNLDFKASANRIDLEGGSLGVYGSLSSHSFFADVLVKNDWLALNYKVQGTGKAKTHGHSLGASGDLGYRFGSARGFVEPMVSLTTSRTKIDDFFLGGTAVSPDASTSSRIGVGARLGLADMNYAMSLTARVWNGIGDGNDVNVSGAGLNVAVSNSGYAHGVSGELSGKISVNLSDAGMLFAGGAVQFGKGITSESVNGGVRFAW
jgi:Autotransporter beta-domain/Autochaperone Domain Type 1